MLDRFCSVGFLADSDFTKAIPAVSTFDEADVQVSMNCRGFSTRLHSDKLLQPCARMQEAREKQIESKMSKVPLMLRRNNCYCRCNLGAKATLPRMSMMTSCSSNRFLEVVLMDKHTCTVHSYLECASHAVVSWH